MRHRWFIPIGKFFARLLFPTKVYDKNNESSPAIVVANHVSALDPLTIYINSKNLIHFMYKSELREKKSLRKLLDWLEYIPVNRGEADFTATKTTLRMLKEGKTVGIFAEGTRNVRLDCLQEFKTGVAMFAIKTQTPIRPVYLWDRTKLFRRNYMIVGEEFTLEAYYGQPLNKEVLTAATQVIFEKVEGLRIQLNEILAKKGVKRRKLSKKEQENLNKANLQTVEESEQ